MFLDADLALFFICMRILLCFLYACGFYSVFYTHTDLTDLVRGGALTGEHEIFLNTRFAVGPLTEGR